jgi:hypothetical protein
VVGAGGPAGIDGGEFAEPVAVQAVQQPPQLEDPRGPGPVGQAVGVGAASASSSATTAASPPGELAECVFESMVAT